MIPPIAAASSDAIFLIESEFLSLPVRGKVMAYGSTGNTVLVWNPSEGDPNALLYELGSTVETRRRKINANLSLGRTDHVSMAFLEHKILLPFQLGRENLIGYDVFDETRRILPRNPIESQINATGTSVYTSSTTGHVYVIGGKNRKVQPPAVQRFLPRPKCQRPLRVEDAARFFHSAIGCCCHTGISRDSRRRGDVLGW